MHQGEWLEVLGCGERHSISIDHSADICRYFTLLKCTVALLSLCSPPFVLHYLHFDFRSPSVSLHFTLLYCIVASMLRLFPLFPPVFPPVFLLFSH